MQEEKVQKKMSWKKRIGFGFLIGMPQMFVFPFVAYVTHKEIPQNDWLAGFLFGIAMSILWIVLMPWIFKFRNK